MDYFRWINWAGPTFEIQNFEIKNKIWKFGNFDPGPSRWRNTCCRWTEERSLRSGRTSLCWQAVFTFSIFMKKLYLLSCLSVSNSRISKEVGLVDQHQTFGISRIRIPISRKPEFFREIIPENSGRLSRKSSDDQIPLPAETLRRWDPRKNWEHLEQHCDRQIHDSTGNND